MAFHLVLKVLRLDMHPSTTCTRACSWTCRWQPWFAWMLKFEWSWDAAVWTFGSSTWWRRFYTCFLHCNLAARYSRVYPPLFYPENHFHREFYFSWLKGPGIYMHAQRSLESRFAFELQSISRRRDLNCNVKFTINGWFWFQNRLNSNKHAETDLPLSNNL